jgi:hypothetical protein
MSTPSADDSSTAEPHPHSYDYCRKLVLHEDYSDKVSSEEHGWLNILFDYTLLDIKKANDNDFLLGRRILLKLRFPPEDLASLPDELLLCGSSTLIPPSSF